MSCRIVLTSVFVEDQERALVGLGAELTQEPTQMGPVTIAVLDDTCGNLIQIAQRS